jgi:N-glycosylase/DNA lyase
MENMEELIKKIQILKNSDISNVIKGRIDEFKSINKKSNDELFKEMCFCLLTANYNAEKSIIIQNEIGECFLNDTREDLCNKLKKYGHRFPNARAEYICGSLKHKDNLKEIVKFHDKKALRDWFVNNIKGLGYKEASHFLRNIGFNDYAIIDFHIIDILTEYDIIKKPKSLTKNKYLEIEETLRKIAFKTDLTLAELDLYLWYMETGKILK